MQQNRASPFASDFLTADAGIAENSAMGIKFVSFNRRENHSPVAMVNRKEIVHWALKNRATLWGGQ